MGVYRRGRRWWIRYTVDGVQHREPAGHSRKVAEQILERRRAEILLGSFQPRSKRTRLREYEATYMAWSKEHKRSWRRDRSSLKHLVEHLGEVALADLRHSRIEAYQRARLREEGPGGRTPKPATINREVRCLTRLLRLAVRDGVLSEHPAKSMTLLPEHNVRTRVITDDEYKALLDEAPVWFKPMLVVAHETGMRAGELALLTWNEVDLTTGFIRLRSDQTKAGEGRSIPLSEAASQALRGLPRPLRGGRVFLRRGEPLRDGDAVSSAFRCLREKAGIEGIVFHDFRRTRAGRWRREGHDYFRIMRALGHRTMNIFRRYNPVEEEELLALVGRSGE